ncbi:hypothetical protein [Streptomyces sp. NPDC058953]|uniref:hypothetical protein n=1 Tax=unclassified Streptomyces TaxID=2593676 RepID=UPI003673F230
MLSAAVPGILRRALGPRWEFTLRGDYLTIEHPQRGTPYRPPSRRLTWDELLNRLEGAFAGIGVPRADCLPLRWGRETELTVSAVQALDPCLKDRRAVPYRQGFLPQPVVRLTGHRDRHGNLLDGFLTSFVNASRVQPVPDARSYGTILDEWLTVLSLLGLHARHITVYGTLKVWRRRQVEGVTLRYDHAGLPLGDIVLLRNADDPSRMAVDLGTSLERLAWVRSRLPWHQQVFGPLAGAAPPAVLDAIRTVTLLVGHGITPTARGAGSVTRRIADRIPPSAAALGLSTAVRHHHAYWDSMSPLPVPWWHVASALEVHIQRPPRGGGHRRPLE